MAARGSRPEYSIIRSMKRPGLTPHFLSATLFLVVTASTGLEAQETMTNPAAARAAKRSEELLKRFDTVLNIFGDEQREMLDSEVQNLIDERQEARRRRDFARGDEIRDELASRGIILEDTKDGVRWKRK